MVAVVLALAGCREASVYDDWSSQKTAETADMARVNAANALARVNELEGEVAELTTALEDEQRERQVLEAELSEFEKFYNRHTH